jgi:hypothetical protein
MLTGIEPRSAIDEWCTGKIWWWRAVLLAVLVYQWMGHLRDPLYSGIFSMLTLALHELGHLLFQPFGEWMMVAGGSIVQVAAPVASSYMFIRQPDFFAIAVCGGWLADSLFNMATYMSDATKLEMEVVTIGGAEPITPNDWYYLLSSVDLLLWDQRIANGLRFTASLIMVASIVFGVWLVLKIMRGRLVQG